MCSGVEWSGAGCDDSGNGTAMHKINLFPSAALCLGLMGGVGWVGEGREGGGKDSANVYKYPQRTRAGLHLAERS